MRFVRLADWKRMLALLTLFRHYLLGLSLPFRFLYRGALVYHPMARGHPPMDYCGFESASSMPSCGCTVASVSVGGQGHVP